MLMLQDRAAPRVVHGQVASLRIIWCQSMTRRLCQDVNQPYQYAAQVS